MLFNKVLNLGIKPKDDINRIRLIRQINGLNLFYTFVAFSVGVISFTLLKGSLGGMLLGYVQIFATFMYASNLIVNIKSFKKFVRHQTIIAFEIHLFLCALITGFFDSPVMLVIVLYPLLAALVEVSIFTHLFVGFFQLCLVTIFHFKFRVIEDKLISILGDSSSYKDILRLMGLAYFPLMGAGIMKIIFSENLKARVKQKEMIQELSTVHQKLKVYAEALKDESVRLKAEVDVAKDIQAMVLPDKRDFVSLKDQEVSCIMRPADEVGGDYYDVIHTDGKILFGIGDVTGHGLASGLIMLMAQTAIRTIVETKNLSFDQYIPLLNRVLYSNINRINENRNMTLSLFSYLGDGNYIMTGQHEYYLIYRAASKTIEVEDTSDHGFFVGMLEEVKEFSKFSKFHLKKDDVLLLFSDGVTEAENREAEQFGLDRLEKLFIAYGNKSAEKIKLKLMQKIYNFIGDKEILDDISLLIIKQKETL